MDRRTKIVATLGPATDRVIGEIVAAGVDVVRLNLSHGEQSEHLERIGRVRRLSATKPVGIMVDLPGPKIRAAAFGDGSVKNESAAFAAGELVQLVSGQPTSSVEVVSIDVPDVLGAVGVGDRVVIGDGAVSLRVLSVDGGRVMTRVESGGAVQGRPGIHIAGGRLGLVTPTEVDLELADHFASVGVDFVAVSFVRTAADLQRVREVVDGRARVIAKIENAEAVDHLEAIVAAADGVMVARGDLGIDLPIEDVPHVQKVVINRCREAGVPVITATQMLESMIHAPLPTRAEVSDVANAVLDGTDAVMLSAETAIGTFPLEVVATMDRILRRAERAEDPPAAKDGAGGGVSSGGRRQTPEFDPVTDAMTAAAARAADELDASAIICCTTTGRTARAMARLRPTAQLLTVTPRATTVLELSLSWGIDAIVVEAASSTAEMVEAAIASGIAAGRLEVGQTVIVIAGHPESPSGSASDLVRAVRIQ